MKVNFFIFSLPLFLTNAKLLRTIMSIINSSKYLCSTILKHNFRICFHLYASFSMKDKLSILTFSLISFDPFESLVPSPTPDFKSASWFVMSSKKGYFMKTFQYLCNIILSQLFTLSIYFLSLRTDQTIHVQCCIPYLGRF